MLQTLIKLGRQAGLSLGEWDDILHKPKFPTQTKKGDKITNYIAPLIFNLDEGISSLGKLIPYDEEKSPERFFNVKIQGGNNKAIYTCVETKGFEQLRKSFFGIPDKNGNPSVQGQFTEAIDKGFPDLQTTPLYEVLQALFQHRDAFESSYLSEKGSADPRKIIEALSLQPNEQVVLLVVGVIWAAKGWDEPVYFRDIDGYKSFLKRKFLDDNSLSSDEKQDPRLCYATGELRENVREPESIVRYNLNKMFVTTTINYANNFDGGNFSRNYQIDRETLTDLERGSQKLLNEYKTKIAGIDHCIIPQLLHSNSAPIENTLDKLSRQSDLLFQYKIYEEIVAEITDEVDEEPYWINFLGFESDGNFFKTINIIKDVSRTHFERLIRQFRIVNEVFKSLEGVNWGNVMSVGDGNVLEFNMFTAYSIIPVRKDKEKKNLALVLFKQLLEKRPIEREKLFGYFRELILCHRFARYSGYTNIRKNSIFDFAIRDAVFQYLALFQVLKPFKLIHDMEQTDNPIPEAVVPSEQSSESQKKMEVFFTKMDYNDSQKALFYLGRVLSTVARKQYEKGYTSKPVLNKLNYNGMNKDDILKLKKDLSEKTQQYSLHTFTEPAFSRFTELFNYNKWSMKPNEALFFILSGYSFYSK